MCKERKYDRYVVEIIHLNGNKQIKKNDNPESYTSMINFYKIIKNEYMNYEGVVKINFVGISDYERKIIFTKKNSIIEENSKNIIDLLNIIVNASDKLHSVLENANKKINVMNKEKSNIEHLLIESINAEEISDEDKLKTFNKLREITLKRRDYKILNDVRLKLNCNLNLIKTKSKDMLKEYENIINTNTQISQDLIHNEDSKFRKTHVVREYPYKTFKEKNTLTNQLKNKYDKIIDLSDRSVLACYKKCVAN